MEYHVLSNSEMKTILMLCIFLGSILCPIFMYFAKRDASNSNIKKGLMGKIVPWLVLMILISQVVLLTYQLFSYPWNIEPQPSQASVYREMEYLGSDYPLWGWANDYQLPILSTLAGCIMWFCWTIYSFKFKSSDTIWWKKVCKVIAYLIISATILGFYIHELRDISGYLIISAIVALLLWVARVKSTSTKIKTASIINVYPKDEPTLKQSESDNDFTLKESTIIQPEPLEQVSSSPTAKDEQLLKDNERIEEESKDCVPLMGILYAKRIVQQISK